MRLGKVLQGGADPQSAGAVNMEKRGAVTADEIAERPGRHDDLAPVEFSAEIVPDLAQLEPPCVADRPDPTPNEKRPSVCRCART